MTLTEATTAEVSRELAQATLKLIAVMEISTGEQARASMKAAQLARNLLKPEQPPPHSEPQVTKPTARSRAAGVLQTQEAENK